MLNRRPMTSTTPPGPWTSTATIVFDCIADDGLVTIGIIVDEDLASDIAGSLRPGPAAGDQRRN